MSANQRATMFIPLALLIMCYAMDQIHCATAQDVNSERFLLLNFKQAITNDPTGVLNTWNTSTPFCHWKGIVCSPSNQGRVTKLDLSGHGLSGLIDPSIGNLTFLRTLDLSRNQLTGWLPPPNNLQEMRVLNLSYNLLDGMIPDTLTNCSNLRIVDLSHNLLRGEIPMKIGFLSNLFDLVLSYNNLTGTIPATLGNITRIKRIALAHNNLTGDIPDELGRLSNISVLLLGFNKLSGGISPALLNLSSLERLTLEANNLGNGLPLDIGNKLPNLREFFLSGNLFGGQIPASLGNASGLEKIDLSHNRFTGEVPSSFGKLLNLSMLILLDNKLQTRDGEGWEFIHALKNCSNLTVLGLNQNQLMGAIPDSIGNLSTSLQYLLLGGNGLSGLVPASIGNLEGLLSLGLAYNNLSGAIEDWKWIGKLTKLQALYLQSNNFTGSIPSSIGNFTYLTELNLASNQLEGPIPPSFGNLQQLTTLNLGYNNIQGLIPDQVCSLNNLVRLQLSSNKLSGDIPDSWGQNLNLLNIVLDQNFLTGNIPITFGNIQSLSVLNISHNNLSGTIPVTLSDLKSLMQLDISFNHLRGKVPINGVFANATAVSLDGNWGLCGGGTFLHMPSCPAASRRVDKQYYLIRVLIPVFGFLSLVLLAYFLVLERKKRTEYLQPPSFGDNFLKVSYKDLAQATMDFSESNLIGRGSYGSVYRGKLKETKVEVAVKVFNLEMPGAEKSFMSECEALRSIQHRNLLPIITACSTVDNNGHVFKALVYEFMPNGNLDTWLHHNGEGKTAKHLTLMKRIDIVVNIADALDYLHNDCGRPIVHCDLKPSNILLDEDMNALLGDFGIARFYLESSSTSMSSTSSFGLKGTIGYIAPEYGAGGHTSIFGDVYSFGIVLLEMMTGKRPTNAMFNDGINIVNFVHQNLPHKLFDVIDGNLIEECKNSTEGKILSENVVCQCFISLLEVALSCTSPLPSDRISSKQIASKMHAIKTAHLMCQNKKQASPEELL